MVIKTKYSIGDEVWFGSLGFEESAKICEININVVIDGDVRIEYGLEKSRCYWKRNEHEIFLNKEEFLKSL